MEEDGFLHYSEARRSCFQRSASPMELWAGLDMTIGPSVLKLRPFLNDSDVGLYPDSEASWTSVPFSPFGSCPSPETNCNSFSDIFLPIYPTNNNIHSIIKIIHVIPYYDDDDDKDDDDDGDDDEEPL